MQMALPPWMSMASMMHFWARSVRWYLTMAEMTDRLLAQIDAGHRQLGGGAHDVGVAAQACQRLFDAFHLADGQLELATDAAVGTGGQGQHLDAARAVGGQGDAATDDRHSTSMRQP